jgi:hypothetical protein
MIVSNQVIDRYSCLSISETGIFLRVYMPSHSKAYNERQSFPDEEWHYSILDVNNRFLAKVGLVESNRYRSC